MLSQRVVLATASRREYNSYVVALTKVTDSHIHSGALNPNSRHDK